jgi:hypothetical protein
MPVPAAEFPAPLLPEVSLTRRLMKTFFAAIAAFGSY